LTEFLDDIDNEDFEDFEPETFDEWHTKDGRIIPIKNMTTQHIKNCIKMINDNRPTPQHMFTDNAQDLADIEYENSVEYADNWIEAFEYELKTREGK